MVPRRLDISGLILALTLLPSGTRSQTVAPLGEKDWQRIIGLEPGTRIAVALKTGEKRIGEFRRATADEVTIAVRPNEKRGHVREEMVPKALIATVATAPDRLLNGVLIGAGIGTGFAVWDYLIDPSEPGNAAFFTVAIGLGMAIGAGIDAL